MQQTLPASITQRGQVTLPAAIRRLLGVDVKTKILFHIEKGGRVSVSAAPFTYKTVRASVAPLKKVSEADIQETLSEAHTARYICSRSTR